MSFVHGKDSAFSIADATGTMRDLSRYIDNVSGLPGGRNLSEVTAFGDQGTRSIPGLANVTFTVSGHFDATQTTGPHAVLNSLRTASEPAAFEYGPAGSGAGKPKLSGACWLTEYSVDSSVSEKVSFSATFQVDGVVNDGTY